jgi:hypothetical protein
MNIDAPNTGVITASILKVNNKAIVMNGKSTLLFLSPGIARVRLVINKFVNETVVLTPARITATIKRSWLPTLVNLVLQEKGVMNAQPAVTDVLSEHLVT